MSDIYGNSQVFGSYSLFCGYNNKELAAHVLALEVSAYPSLVIGGHVFCGHHCLNLLVLPESP